MVRAEGTKIFDFDNPRSLEKALSGTELHRKSKKFFFVKTKIYFCCLTLGINKQKLLVLFFRIDYSR